MVTTVAADVAPGERVLLPTGIALALPEGYAAFVHPRSGLAVRYGVSVSDVRRANGLLCDTGMYARGSLLIPVAPLSPVGWVELGCGGRGWTGAAWNGRPATPPIHLPNAEGASP